MILNITDKLGMEEQKITIAEGKTYTVNCRAKAMIKVQEAFKKDNSFEGLFDAIELFLGKKARKEIYDMDLTIKQLQTVVIAIMAQVNEISYEEMADRFQKSIK